MPKKLNIGIIGAGNMGAAIISGIYQSHRVWIHDVDPALCRRMKRQYKIDAGSLEDILNKCSIVILAVKPQQMDEVLSLMSPHVYSQHLIISIAAGITCAYIESRLGQKPRVVRTMPNLPARVKAAVTAVTRGKYADKKDLDNAVRIFNLIGKTIIVDEKSMDMITAVSGSGPAYVFLCVECLEKASRHLGLSPRVSKILVEETLRGSLALLFGQKEDAARLRKRVTSKGGTTQAAMDVFGSYKIENIFKEALAAACRRAKELARK